MVFVPAVLASALVVAGACEGPSEVERQSQPAVRANEDQYLYGDWTGRGETRLAVRRGNCVYMDTDQRGGHDMVQCYGDGDQLYLVGDWDGDGRDNLAVRIGRCIYMDHDFDGAHDEVRCPGVPGDQYLVGDWNADGRDDLAVRSGTAIYMYTDPDAQYDRVQWYGSGNGQAYLVGDWDGDRRDNVAVRSGNCVLVDTDFDSHHNHVYCFGDGDGEDEYVFGKWRYDSYTREYLAVRRHDCVHMDTSEGGAAELVQCYGMGTRFKNPPPGPLQYLLSDRLKLNGCSGDRDGDCLADRQENELAQLINPINMWDEREDCFENEVFYQVRPVAVSGTFKVSRDNPVFVQSSEDFVDRWYPMRGKYYVAVTFLLAFRLDCNTKAGAITAGHVGDGEAVTYLLSSVDLATWTIEQGLYRAHGANFFFDRGHLEGIARDLGRTNPVIASDEDGHGSYPGEGVHSSTCDLDDRFGNREGFFGRNLRNCFAQIAPWDDGHLGSAFVHGQYRHLLDGSSRERNIGEPGHWNGSFLRVSNGGRTAAIVRGGVTEFLSDEPRGKFCGWMCPERDGNGDCRNRISFGPITGSSTCTAGLWGAVDKSCFRVRGFSSGCAN